MSSLLPLLLLLAAGAAPAPVTPPASAPAAPPASAPAPPPASAPAALPPEDLVRALREARIAGLREQPDVQRAALTKAVEAFPGEPLAWLSLYTFERAHGTPESQAALLDRVRGLLREGPHELPPGLLVRVVDDPRTTPEELQLVRDYALRRRAEAPGDPLWPRLLVDVGRRTADAPLAVDGCRALLAVDGGDAGVQLRCAEVFRGAGLKEDADRLLQRMGHGQGPAAPAGAELNRMYGARVAALAAEGDTAGLEALFAEATARRVDLQSFDLVGPAFALVDAGRDEDAERYFRWVAHWRPGSEAERVLVGLYGSDEEKARAAAAETASLDGLTATALIRLGAEKYKQGDAKGALAVFEKATAKAPGSDVAWYNLGLAARKLKDDARAEAALARAVEIRPAFFEALTLLAAARCDLQRFDEARAALDAAAALPNANAEEIAKRRARCDELRRTP